MSHIFDVHNKKKLSSPERQRLLTPPKTLKNLGYREGFSFADIGSGTGLFTFAAAEIGGQAATIYAVDISTEMLADVRKHAEDTGVKTITTVLSDPYDFKLNTGCADFILICTVLHEIEDKTRFLAEARRICADNGKIVIIDFTEKNLGFGPPLPHRLPAAHVGTMLTSAGFSAIESTSVSEAFYAVTGIAN